MAKNLVLCLDGTGNQAKGGTTNVLSLYGMLDHARPAEQVTYYDPGLGTFSLQGAWTPWARWSTRVAGLAFGLGLRQNVSEAYTFILRNWLPGDRIYLFGFSRGAYTACVLAALLHRVGILRPGAENLIPYMSEMFLRSDRGHSPGDSELKWLDAKQFRLLFEAKDRHMGSVPVAFAGLWDTVNAVGFLRRHSMPFARSLPSVQRVRHAVSVDEIRGPYRPQLVLETHKDVVETWFPGVHSDVGGGFRDDRTLALITLAWMVNHAEVSGVKFRRREVALLMRDPTLRADGLVHRMAWYWRVLGTRRRCIPEGARVHSSVRDKMALDSGYKPRLPSNVVWEDPPPSWPVG